MQGIEDFLLWVAHDFDTPRYLFHTKLQAVFWSIADLVLIFAFLKIIDRLKKKTGDRGVYKRFWLLYFSALLKIFLFFLKKPTIFLSLDYMICGLQYAILLYTVIADWKTIMRLPQYYQNIRSQPL